MTHHSPPADRRSRRSVLGLFGAVPLGAGAAWAGARTASADDTPGPDRHTPGELGPGGTFDRHLAGLAARDEFSGTVLLAHRGRTVLFRCHGTADRRRGIPIGTDTRFALASTTKLFTAVAVQQLVRAGAISHHERLGAYLGGLLPALDGLTVHQLLTHTSGTGDYRTTQAFRDGARVWGSAAELHDGIMSIVRAAPPEFPAGTRFRYSNSGYELLGALVTAVSGRPYETFVHERVFRPAGMDSTGWYPRPRWDTEPDFARPYARQPSGERTDVLADKPFTGTAAGDAFSTARDLARFGRALATGRLLGPAHTPAFLSGKLALPSRAESPGAAPPAATLQGYGPVALLTGGQWVLRHSGGSAGTGTSVEIHPGTGWVSVVLGNYDADSVLPVASRARELITAAVPGPERRSAAP
ncbi:serine hydrolase domain-containing protein [Streptomyces sp. NPDC003691]